MEERDFFRDDKRATEKKILFVYIVLFWAVLMISDNLRHMFWSAVIMLFGLSISWYLIHKHFQTDLKLLENIEKLQQEKQGRDTLLTSISKEINIQLETICDMNEVLLGEKMTDAAKRAADSVRMSGKNLQTIVRNMMDFSELQAGKVTLNEECYNFSSVMNEVLDEIIRQNAEKNLEIIVDCDTDIPSGLMGDSQKISRIMTCLINNAICFTEEKCIKIRVSMRNEDYGGNLCISVSGAGSGMTLEQIEEFMAGSDSMGGEVKSQNPGIEIGLVIARKLVTVMRGFISVKSELGQGNEVQIVIPQKVVDTKPIAELKDKRNIRINGNYNNSNYLNRELEIPNKPKMVSEKLIDEKMGTEYCGGETEDYREVLKVYYNYANSALKDMERYFEEKNWNEYSLLVHSLKSSSLGIGAEALFKLAKEQEMAAKEEMETELLKNHRPMMELYEKVLKEIEDILQEE